MAVLPEEAKLIAGEILKVAFAFSFKVRDLMITLLMNLFNIDKVRNWMAVNWLNFSDSKTELIIFGSKGHLSKIDIDSVTIGESSIPTSDYFKSNIWCNLKMKKLVDQHGF